MADILYVTRPMVPPWNEGSQRLTWQIATGLQQYQAHLLTAEGIAVPSENSHIHWQRPYTQQQLTNGQRWRLLKYMWRLPQPVDLLHFYFVPTLPTSLLFAFLMRRLGLPSVQTVPSLPKGNMSAAEAARIFFADKIVTYTRETAVFLRQRGLENVTHINVGIDTARYTAPFDRAALRHRLKLPQEAALILYAGEYTRLGAVDQLRRIMPLVIGRCPECHFVFACRLLLPTDAGIKADLEKWVAANGWTDRVHFLGEVPDFPALLHASDIFVFPATDMTGKIDTPLTILEAMAAGLPVLAYEALSLAEIFGKGAALLLPNGNVAAMAATMIDLVRDRERRQHFGQHLRQIVQARYCLQKMVTAYENLYSLLI